MFNPNRLVIDAFVTDSLHRFREAFPNPDGKHEAVLEQTVRTALESLLRCDCPYHDLQHTILVADVGQTILRGRLISQGDVLPLDWIHALIAMLFHDIGYIRGLLREDADNSYVIDAAGNRISLPVGASDAALMQYHVARGCLFIQERFASHPIIDANTIADHIEMTRFPVPATARHQRLDTYGALVRCADLIGQMGDPAYDRKLGKLFSEFVETGESERLGYHNADELRSGFAEFFYDQVYPYLGEGLRFLRQTEDGLQWIASLFHRAESPQNGLAVSDAEAQGPSRPHIAISNQ